MTDTQGWDNQNYKRYLGIRDEIRRTSGQAQAEAKGKMGETFGLHISNPHSILNWEYGTHFKKDTAARRSDAATLVQDKRDDRKSRAIDVDFEALTLEEEEILSLARMTTAEQDRYLSAAWKHGHIKEEIKTDFVAYRWGNLSVEAWSRYNLNAGHNQQGWLYYTESDWLIFCLPPDERKSLMLTREELEKWDNSEGGRQGHGILAMLPYMPFVCVRREVLADYIRENNLTPRPGYGTDGQLLYKHFLIPTAKIFEIDPEAFVTFVPIIHVKEGMTPPDRRHGKYLTIKDEWMEEENEKYWYQGYGRNEGVFKEGVLSIKNEVYAPGLVIHERAGNILQSMRDKIDALLLATGETPTAKCIKVSSLETLLQLGASRE